MMRKALLIICVIALAGLWCVGCKDQEPEVEPGYDVGTMDDYRQEVEADITEENAEDELSKLGAEIDAEIAAE